MSKNEIIDLDISLDTKDEKEEKEVLKNRTQSSKDKKITYQKVKGKDRQYEKGLRIKLVNGKKWGYEATFCIGYEDVVDKKTNKVIRKQIKQRKSFTTKEKALSWLKEMGIRKAELAEKNQVIDKHGYTVVEVCQMYKDDKIAHGATRGQIQDLNVMLNHYKNFFVKENNKYVKTIDTAQIQEYLDYEVQQNKSDKSIAKYKSTLKQIWQFMLRDKNKFQVYENVVIDAVNYGKPSGFRPVALKYTELQDLILEFCQLEDPTFLFIAVFSYTQALRRGELCGLQWGDIDFENRTIKIQHNRVQRNKSNKEGVKNTDKNNVKKPKREKIRVIELHKAGYDTITLYKKWQEEKLGRKVHDDEFVLMFEINLKYNYLPSCGKISRRWTEQYNRINKYRKRKGLTEIPYAREHDGRETYSTLCLSGVKKADGTIVRDAIARQVYESMGHSLPRHMQNITETVYNQGSSNRWDITRFWDELLEIDIKSEWETFEQIRKIDFETLPKVEQERLKHKKKNRFEKAYKEKLQGNPPREEIDIYEEDTKEVEKENNENNNDNAEKS